MNATISFYDPQTGLFTGESRSGPAEWLASCVPDGLAAAPGLYDRLSQRVDLVTMEVVDYQPPAPDDDELRTWAWDATERRWKPAPTTTARWAIVREQRNGLLSRSDWVVTRAAECGEPVPPAWVTYRQALRDVTTQPDPFAVTWPFAPT
jgi:hypothetical protein